MHTLHTSMDERGQDSYRDYRSAAVTLWGDAGAYAHDAYRDIRDRLYPELPESLPIVIGLTAYGHCMGLTRSGWRHGPRISLHSSVFAAGWRQVDDLLIHEALHAWLYVTGRNVDHDSEDWYAAVRRLSRLVLGHDLNIKRGSDRKSVRVPNPAYEPGIDDRKTVVRKERVADMHAKVAGWPQPFRPDGWYDLAAPIPCPSY